MKKNLFLTTILLAGLVAPAFADDVATPDNKITGGAGTCTVDVLGVSADGATANTIAMWSLNSYECAAGQYLDETTLECTECPVGSYCPGGTFTVEANNSKTACPADYTSDAAATAESECYMGCELACSVNAECPPHSKNCVHSAFTTTGRQYVDGACNAYPSVCPIADFGCDIGYSKTELTAMEVAEKFLAMVDDSDELDTGLAPELMLYCDLYGNDGTPQGDINILENSISDCDYIAPGHILLVPSDASDALFMISLTKNEYNGADIPGAIKAENERYLLRNADFNPGVTGDNMWIRFSNMFLPTPDTELVMRFMSGDLVPPQDATTMEKQLEWMSTLVSTDLMNKIQQNPSILNDQSGMALMLATYRDVSLPNTWVTEVDDWLLMRILYLIPLGDMYGSFDTEQEWIEVFFGGAKYCNNNTININWNPDNGGASTQNMCYYDGPVTLPSDPVKPGYTFMGWKLLEETTTE